MEGPGKPKNPFLMSFLLQVTRSRTWKHNSAKTFPTAFQRWSKKPLWTFTPAKRKQPSGPAEEWINKRGLHRQQSIKKENLVACYYMDRPEDIKSTSPSKKDKYCMTPLT